MPSILVSLSSLFLFVIGAILLPPGVSRGLRVFGGLVFAIALMLFTWFIVGSIMPWEYKDLGVKRVAIIDGIATAIVDGQPINLNDVGNRNFTLNQSVRVLKPNDDRTYAGMSFVWDKNRYPYRIEVQDER